MAKVHHMVIKKAQRLADEGRITQDLVDDIAAGNLTIENAIAYNEHSVMRDHVDLLMSGEFEGDVDKG